MDLAPEYDAPFVVKLLGADKKTFIEVPFVRVDWTEIKALGAKLKKASLASVYARATETQIQSWEKFRALQELDARGSTVSAAIRYSQTDEGAEDIYNQQATKSGLSPDDAAKVFRALGPMGVANLAGELLSAADPKLIPPATQSPPSNPS